MAGWRHPEDTLQPYLENGLIIDEREEGVKGRREAF